MDFYYQQIDQLLLTTKETFSGSTHVLKKYHHYTFLKINDVTKLSLYPTKIRYVLLIPFQDAFFLG